MKKSLFTLLLAGTLLFSGNPTQAAVVVVSAETHDASYNLTSLTIAGTTYSYLTGTSTASVVGQGHANLLDYWLFGTTPALTAGSANASVTGLSYRDGTTNLTTGSLFQFGRVITASDRIFFSDLGVNSDPINFQLIDSSNNVISTYVGPSVIGGTAIIASTTYSAVYDDTGLAATVGAQGQVMMSFQLSDFTGGTGGFATATGLRLSNVSGWDPSVVGLASTVPEPATWVLLAGSLTAVMVLRRRMK